MMYRKFLTMSCDWLIYSIHYLSAADWTLEADTRASYGILGSYAVIHMDFSDELLVIDTGRPYGTGPEDVTSFHPWQRKWCSRNPPSILYMFQPTKGWKECTEVGTESPRTHASG